MLSGWLRTMSVFVLLQVDMLRREGGIMQEKGGRPALVTWPTHLCFWFESFVGTTCLGYNPL